MPDELPTQLPPVIVVAPRQAVQWVIAGMLAIIATILIVQGGSSWSGVAQAQSGGAGGGLLGARGVFAFTGPIDQTRYGLWMMDVDNGTIWCYEYNPVKQRMRLVAARSFLYDRSLKNWNQDEPTPDTVLEQLNRERQRQLNLRAAARNNAAAGNAATRPSTTAPAGASGS